jgi:orotate phosphoribosyltransferase
MDECTPKYVHCGWLTIPSQRISCDAALELAVKTLKDKDVEFDTVAFCGMSGAMFGPILAHLMNKEVLAVRKDEQRHSYYDTEGHKRAARVLIVDDFRSSGNTMRRIMYRTRQLCGKEVVFVGTLYYHLGHQGFFPLNAEPIDDESPESRYLAHDLRQVIECEKLGSDPECMLWSA